MEFDSSLDIPSEFPFPFPPYDIQCQFMEKLYFALEHKKLGIFESPTGTGKSLSILCGAIKWLKDHNNHIKSTLSTTIEALEIEKEKINSDENDWFTVQTKQMTITQKINQLKIQENKINDYNKKIEKIQSDGGKTVNIKSKKYVSLEKSKTKSDIKNITDLDDSDEKSSIEEADVLLEESDQIGNNEYDDDDDETEEDKNFRPTQIIIASRTHSQLSQFIGEIIKSPFSKDIRVILLASRQNYCINPDVKKLHNQALMNERCLDMQKKRSETHCRVDSGGKVIKKQRSNNQCQCPFYKPLGIENLQNFALTEVHDIEDLVQVGKEIIACPYYASRKAAEDAEIVLVPYNTLLHKSTREANGLHIKDNIVIIDEAHNLLESLSQMYGSDLYYPQVYYSLEQLKYYKKRYNTKFSANNLRHLNQLIFVINKLLMFLDKDVKEDVTDIFTLENFVLSAEIEQYNFFNLITFCKRSKIAQKVRCYSLKHPLNDEMAKKQPTKTGIKDFLASIENKKQNQSVKEQNGPVKEECQIPIPNNPLLAIISFLESLTYSYNDGRILVTKSPNKQHSKMQFLLLNPSSNFSEIVKEARSVIVAGGTMKPYTEFRERLFINSGAENDRILEFSCDHIIPDTNILPIVITKGAKSEKLQFNFTNRMLLASSIKDILLEACNNVKGGIVVFFPSYNYENWIYQQVKDTNFDRKLFREPQNSNATDDVLSKYAATIAKSNKGALLFSVVGGKLSEGLNFSDDLGRCVIVIGLPYANITAPDLKEKMNFLNIKEGDGSGQKFYENLCMKSVNQCIGRAVRHRNDYASVLLVDERYARQTIREALPDWIRRSLQVCEFKETFQLVGQFFKDKTSK